MVLVENQEEDIEKNYESTQVYGGASQKSGLFGAHDALTLDHHLMT